jgi:hypothetical protein
MYDIFSHAINPSCHGFSTKATRVAWFATVMFSSVPRLFRRKLLSVVET